MIKRASCQGSLNHELKLGFRLDVLAVLLLLLGDDTVVLLYGRR